MSDSISEWLINWFAERESGILISDSDDYFEKKIIDSFGVIELIEEVEQHFDVQFDEKNFQDRRFSTISGLSEIVSEIKVDG